MARLLTATMEGRQPEADGLTSLGTITYDTSKQFDGTACAKCGKSAENRLTAAPAGMVTGRTYYARAAVRFSSISPAGSGFLSFLEATAMSIKTVFDGTQVYVEQLGTKLITSGFKPEAEKTYLYELKLLIEAAAEDTVALRIYNEAGETVYESADKKAAIGSSAILSFLVGHVTSGETAVDVYVSHIAINDSTGEKQNSWAGFAKTAELKPVEDGTNVGWSVPGGGTTNLWKALDNRPPVGIADNTKAENAEKQIRDATNNSTDTFIAKLAAYSTALASGGGGMTESDELKLVQARARGGNSSATSRNLGVRCESNPGAGTENTGGTGTTKAGTDPTGWANVFGPVEYAPTVTVGTKPGVRVRKGTASTDIMLYDLVGLVVEYFPKKAEPQTIAISQVTETDTAQALTRRKTLVPAQVSETDTAMAMGRAKQKVIGQVTETDTAQGMAKRVVLAQAAETDTARAITPTRIHSVGQVSETDTAQALSRVKTKILAQASETDAAQAITRAKRKILGQVSESDVAQAILGLKRKAIAQAAESNVAQAISRLKTRAIAQASETDLAQAMAKRKARAVTQVEEINTAQSFASLKPGKVVRRFNADNLDHVTCAVGSSAVTSEVTMAALVRIRDKPGDHPEPTLIVLKDDEGNSGYWLYLTEEHLLGLYSSKPAGGSWNSESSIPLNEEDGWVLAVVKKKAGLATPRFGVYSFTDEAWTWDDGNAVFGDTVSEGLDRISFATAFYPSGYAYPAECDFEAGAIWDRELTDEEAERLVATDIEHGWEALGPVGLWDFKQLSTEEPLIDLTGNGADQIEISGTEVLSETPPMPYTGVLALEQVLEIDTALPFGRQKTRLIAQVVETDIAMAMGRAKSKLLERVLETDTARAIGHPISLAQVTETDTAQPLAHRKRRAIVQVFDLNTALTILRRLIPKRHYEGITGGEVQTGRASGGEVTPHRMTGGEIEVALRGGEVLNASITGGEVEARVSGGEVEARVSGGEVEARVSGGEVEARVSGGEVLNASITGGDVTD